MKAKKNNTVVANINCITENEPVKRCECIHPAHKDTLKSPQESHSIWLNIFVQITYWTKDVLCPRGYFFPLWQNLCFMQKAGKVERDLTAVGTLQ